MNQRRKQNATAIPLRFVFTGVKGVTWITVCLYNAN
jgi:hypothetical protein